MSTFDGRIREYPTIAIDHFKDKIRPEIFVLSHIHADHTVGLEDETFNKKIYCSEFTASMLPLVETRFTSELKFPHLKKYVHPVADYESASIDTRHHGCVKLTFYPANHCPGSSLILIEGDNGTVLYTGDIRAEPHFVKDKLGALQDYRIKNLYMDTTCCRKEQWHFISKADSCKVLINDIKKYPITTHIYLDTWCAGYEEAWFKINDVFKCKIHVSEQRYNLYVALSEKYKEVLTTDHTSTRFHSCKWEKGCYEYERKGYMVAMHFVPTINIKAVEYDRKKSGRSLLQSDIFRHGRSIANRLIPFSTHSSMSEIVNFFKFIKPSKFTPCVAHGGFSRLNEIHELLSKEDCALSTLPSSSDIERGNETSSCSAHSAPSAPSTRRVANSQSSEDSSYNYLSTVEEPRNSTSIPLSEKNNNVQIKISSSANDSHINIKVSPSQNEGNASKQLQNAPVQRQPSLTTITLQRPAASFSNENSTPNVRTSSASNSRINIKISPSQNESNASKQLQNTPIRREPSLTTITLQRPAPSSSNENNTPNVRTSCASHNNSQSSAKKNVPPILRSHSSVSNDAGRSNSLGKRPSQNGDSFSCYNDSSVIVLSVPSTLCPDIEERVYREPEQLVYYSESDDNGNGLAITKESSRIFKKSIAAMRKRRRKNRGKTMNNPIIL